MIKRIITVTMLITFFCVNNGLAEESWEYLTNKYGAMKLLTDGDYLWGKTLRGELIQWDLNTMDSSEIKFTDGQADERINHIAAGTNGTLWVSLYSGTLKQFDGESWHTIEGPEIDSSIMGWHFPASDGSLWLPTNGDGLYRLVDGAWLHYIEADGLKLDTVYDINESADGSLWFLVPSDDSIHFITKTEGIAQFRNDSWKSYAAPDNIGFHALCSDNSNTIWVSGFDGVMYRLDGDVWTQIGEIDNEKLNDYYFYNDLSIAGNTLWRIVRNENSYYDDNKKYISFEYGENCPEIEHSIPDDTKFEYSFNGTLASARELIDLDGDGDTDDGLTWSIYDEGRTLENSSYDWMAQPREDIRFPGHIQIAPDGNFYALSRGAVMSFDGSEWSNLENAGLYDPYTYGFTVAPDGTLFVGGRQNVYSLSLQMTSVDDETASPTALTISGNQPNPFNPETSIQFSLPENGEVTAAVYNATGQKITTLHSGLLTAGNHSLIWNGLDDNGKSLSSGIYFTVIQSGGLLATHKMMLLR